MNVGTVYSSLPISRNSAVFYRTFMIVRSTSEFPREHVLACFMFVKRSYDASICCFSLSRGNEQFYFEYCEINGYLEKTEPAPVNAAPTCCLCLFTAKKCCETVIWGTVSNGGRSFRPVVGWWEFGAVSTSKAVYGCEPSIDICPRLHNVKLPSLPHTSKTYHLFHALCSRWKDKRTSTSQGPLNT